MRCALAGEAAVAGRHLDNIAPCVLGGLTLVLSTDPPRAMRLTTPRQWWVALAVPNVRVATRDARALLPPALPQHAWVQQMAHTAALVAAYQQGDEAWMRVALCDPYAEPRRQHLIPNFGAVQSAALAAGALGCSISGAGPTVFSLCTTEDLAHRCAGAMRSAFLPTASWGHVGPVA
jgi:homoserine kinase